LRLEENDFAAHVCSPRERYATTDMG
jgi:hypothetical protein